MGDASEPGVVRWYRPDPRAVLPLDAFHVPRNLRKLLRRASFELSTDLDFEGIVRACGRVPRPGSHGEEGETWITEPLVDAYVTLHRLGFAHSIECRQEGKLVGGLYGVTLGAAFFGESMFHTVSGASKVALATLVRLLHDAGFQLLDIQFMTPHLRRFGAIEIPREEYESLLHEAIRGAATWPTRLADTADEVSENG